MEKSIFNKKNPIIPAIIIRKTSNILWFNVKVPKKQKMKIIGVIIVLGIEVSLVKKRTPEKPNTPIMQFDIKRPMIIKYTFEV